MYRSLRRIRDFHIHGASADLTKPICDENSLIWPGHEYTLTNLRFAYSINEKDAITSALEWAQTQRSGLHATVPSTLAREIQINPFLCPEDGSYTSLIPMEEQESMTQEELAIASLGNLRKLKYDFQG